MIASAAVPPTAALGAARYSGRSAAIGPRVVEPSTPRERYSENPDGSQRLRLYAGDVGSVGLNTAWTFRSLRLRSSGGVIVPGGDDPFSLRLATRSDAAPLIAMTSEDGVSLTLGLAGGQGLLPAMQGRISGDTVLYPGAVSPRTDLAIRSTISGLDLRFILRAPAETGPFTVTVAAPTAANGDDGAPYFHHLSDDTIVATRAMTVCGDDGSCRANWQLQAEYFIGPALARATGGVTFGPAHLALTPSYSGDGPGAPGFGPHQIAISVDPAWARSQALHYPLTIDLPIATSTSTEDTDQVGTLSSCRPTMAAPLARVIVGQDGHCAYRGLLRFDLMGLLSNSTIHSARLNLFTPGVAGPSGLILYPNGAANSGDATAMPSWNGVPPPREEAPGRPESATSGAWHSWDVTDLIRGWVRDYTTNAGVTLVRLGRPIQIASPLAVGDDPPSSSPYLDISVTRGFGAPPHPPVRGPLVTLHTPHDPVSVAVDPGTHHALVVSNDTCNLYQYTPGSHGSVSVVDTRSGRLITTTPLQLCPLDYAATSTNIAVDSTASRAFVLTSAPLETFTGHAPGPGRVAVLDTRSGAVLATVTVPESPLALAVDERRGRVVVAYARYHGYAEAGGGIVVLDARSGAVLAQRAEPVGPTALAADTRTGRVFAVGADAAGQGSILVLDTLNGALLRRVPIGGPDPVVGYSVGVDEVTGRAFVAWAHGFQDGRLTVLNSAGGAPLATVHMAGSANGIVASPATGVVVTLMQRGLQLFDARSGATLATVNVSAFPIFAALDARAGLLFINDRDAERGPNMLALDARTGAIDAAYRVPARPNVFAVDAPAGRVVVASIDSDTTSIVAAGVAPRTLALDTPVEAAAPACCGAHYFPRKHHNLYGPFFDFWQRNGGVDAFGYPLTEPFFEDGRLVQYTDRARLDLSETGAVTLGPLGRILTADRRFAPVSPAGLPRGSLYFSATRHSLRGRFLAFWRQHGGPQLLGAPLSEVVWERNGDGSGRLYAVQWFEKGRMEDHPELAGTRYEVELGLLGVQALQEKGWLA